MTNAEFRIEHDTLGELRVPAHALWGAQTQRAVENFGLGGIVLPRPMIRALGLVKWAAALANAELGTLEARKAGAIAAAALEVADGRHDAHFPVDVFQTGSGTSSNMNANEVIARLAAGALGAAIHPNDDVNRSQSSNDVIPTAIHVAAAMELDAQVLPALDHLAQTIAGRAREFTGVTKTGRTHLMDALPLTIAQEFGAWQRQVVDCAERLRDTRQRLLRLAQGATAVGTGLNAPPGFGPRVVRHLAERTGIRFEVAPDPFAALAAQDTAVEFSGQLRVAAVALMKIANDLRWMNSGPLAGLGEVALPALQPGSSIMPGKVNPVIPEAVAMAAAAVMGNDATVAIAGQSGNFQLNVMLPLIAQRLLDSERLIANAARALADKAIAGLIVQPARLAEALAVNPVLVTALNPLIGYERAAAIAKRAWAEGRPIVDVAVEETGMERAELERRLDPLGLTGATGRGGS